MKLSKEANLLMEENKTLAEPLPSNLTRRLGRFTLRPSYIEDAPGLILKIMGQCIIVRCEYIYEFDHFEYVAMSLFFDEVPRNQKSPLYELIFSEDRMSYGFRRI